MVAKITWEPSKLADVKPGCNELVVKTIQFGLQKMIMEKDVPIKVRDGTLLYCNVFRPMKSGRYAVVMSADVYGKDGDGRETHEKFATHGSVKTTEFTPFESPDPGYWVPLDYVVVKLALRGSSNSIGDLYPVSTKEAYDYYDAIEWAAVQEWSDGKVGLNGVSYLCMTQWPVAAMNPPHCKAIIPWEGVSDMYRDWSFHGGMPETAFNPYWYKSQCDRWGWQKCFIENMPEEMKKHPLIDEYWRDKIPDLSKIAMPMYVCASWSTQGLHTRGTLEGFKQASAKHKWLEIHGRKEWEVYYSREALERQRRFFDYFLTGIENDWLDTPKVRVEVRERFYDGMTYLENEWPIARTQYTKLFLDTTAMSLSPKAFAGECKLAYPANGVDGEVYGPQFKFKFERDTELTGNMKLKLWVSAEGSDDMDLFVGIKKLDRRGKEVNFPDLNHIEHGHVAPGWLRVSHRELDEARSTPCQPWLKHERIQKLKADEIVPVEVEILPSGTLFRAEETLVLLIQGAEILLIDQTRWPINAGQALPRVRCMHTETVNNGKHVIHAGGKYDSYLLVPVIPARGGQAAP
ncbi:MAG: CocE/NonD family hydrolase [Burkholderiales bacterium]